MNLCLHVAARDSPLSMRQVEEIQKELSLFYPGIRLKKTFLKTTGDLDLITSLTKLDKTNFFTEQVDDLVLKHLADVGIHSAKDLPEPLPEGLKIFALTKGVESHDSLVLRENETLDTLWQGAKIGTSSLRREQNIKALRNDLAAVDIRGTIHQRLELLKEKKIDGLIIAHAALIRLELLHLNWYRLNHETAPLQGRLAIVGREEDETLQELFKPLYYEDRS